MKSSEESKSSWFDSHFPIICTTYILLFYTLQKGISNLQYMSPYFVYMLQDVYI
jgi:hypothetical protein